MQATETFGGCLRRILAKARISASSFARMMGFRSRTSIFRLLQDEASYDKQKEFLEALRGRSELPFDDQDWADLDQALEISHIGAENYWCNQAMRYLVFRSAPQDDEQLKMEIMGKNAGGGGNTCMPGRLLGAPA